MVRSWLALATMGAVGCTTLLGVDGDYVEAGTAGTAQGGARIDSGRDVASGASGSSGEGGVGAAGHGGFAGAAASSGTAGAAGDGSAGVADAGDDVSADAASDVNPSDSGPDSEAGPPCATSIGCPPGLAGPPLVRMTADGGASGFCMDQREVNNAEYLAFLSTVPNLLDQVPPCIAINLTFFPVPWPTPSGAEALPVTGVDYCDALQYCRWAGKRLCGRLGGGSNPSAAFDDPQSSQWMSACSVGGTRDFPYGTAYDALACNGADAGVGAKTSSSGQERCAAGCGAPLNLSGNVAEWEDSCSTTGGAFECRVRGGHFASGRDDLTCTASAKRPFLDRSGEVGFRCCI